MAWIGNTLHIDGGLGPVAAGEEINIDGITVLAGPNGSGKTLIRNHTLYANVSTFHIDFSRITPVQTLELLRSYECSPLESESSGSWYEEGDEAESARKGIAAYVDDLTERKIDKEYFGGGMGARDLRVGKFSEYSINDLSPGEISLCILAFMVRAYRVDARSIVYIESPEAFLSPEWIVEYARILVWINKRIGTRFFVTSHNPDFVAAIRCISEREGTLGKTRFYYAEKTDDGFAWKEAKEDGDDPKSIGPLFEIFTKGIEKIAEYSGETRKETRGKGTVRSNCCERRS